MANVNILICLASPLAVIAMMLTAIALGTDNWLDYTVNRATMKARADADTAFNTTFHETDIYYTRNRGLWRTCFPDDNLCKYGITVSNFHTINTRYPCKSVLVVVPHSFTTYLTTYSEKIQNVRK